MARWTSPNRWAPITLASREKLDNLIFVINCNLQRLDGPVRGNGKVIQELEAAFRGAGWNVIKVIWGGDWDPLLARDTTGLLQKRMGEVVDGEFQTLRHAKTARYVRQNFFGKYPELLDLVAHLSDEELLQAAARRARSRRKSTTPIKQALETKGKPTLILAHTVKGYGLGEAGEGRNISATSRKSSTSTEIAHFRSRFEIPDSGRSGAQRVLLPAAADSPEMSLPARAPPRCWAAICPAAGTGQQHRGAAARVLEGIARRLRRPRSLEHHGVRPRADAAVEASRTRQARCAHHSR